MSAEAERALQEYERLRAEVATLRAEVAEHRAARGIEAPAPWRRSEEALWERAGSDRRVVGEDGEVFPDDCPDGHLFVWDQSPGPWLWRWYSYRNEQLAMGEAATCTGALAAAEAALAGGGT